MKKRSHGSGFGFSRRTMVVEQLEGRSMLAGNIAVSVAGGNLIITGDNRDNAVLVQQGDNPGEYLITGFDFADSGVVGFQAGPTTITGSGTVEVPDLGGTSARLVRNVTGNIIINMNKGNDAVGVGNSIDDLVALAEACGFGLGLGSGSGSASGSVTSAAVTVDQDKLFVPRSLIINLGDGNNSVATIADVTGSEVITGGKNTDNVAVGFGAGSGSGSGSGSGADNDVEIGGSLVISTAKGNDNICVENAVMNGALSINAGDGNNVVHADEFLAATATVVAGNGNDTIAVERFDVDASVVVIAGNGNNLIAVNRFTVGDGFGPQNLQLPSGGGLVSITTGKGNSEIAVTNFDIFGNLLISAGPGNTDVSVFEEDSDFLDGALNGNLNVTLGKGNGTVQLGQPEIVGVVTYLTVNGNVAVVLGGGNYVVAVNHVVINGSATIVGSGARNVAVAVDDSTISRTAAIYLGRGTGTLDVFGSTAGTFIADGGSGRSTFNNDLGIDSNGVTTIDGRLVVVTRFRFFNAP
jgi:hypothetical protein